MVIIFGVTAPAPAFAPVYAPAPAPTTPLAPPGDDPCPDAGLPGLCLLLPPTSAPGRDPGRGQ